MSEGTVVDESKGAQKEKRLYCGDFIREKYSNAWMRIVKQSKDGDYSVVGVKDGVVHGTLEFNHQEGIEINEIEEELDDPINAYCEKENSKMSLTEVVEMKNDERKN